LRCTPAMEAGVFDHVWSLDEIVGLLDLAWNCTTTASSSVVLLMTWVPVPTLQHRSENI